MANKFSRNCEYNYLIGENLEVTVAYYSYIEQNLILEARVIEYDDDLKMYATKGKVKFKSFKYDRYNNAFIVWNIHTIKFEKYQYVMDMRTVKTKDYIHRYIKVYNKSFKFRAKVDQNELMKMIENNSDLYYTNVLDNSSFPPYKRMIGSYNENNLPDILIQGSKLTSFFQFWVISNKKIHEVRVDGTETQFNYPKCDIKKNDKNSSRKLEAMFVNENQNTKKPYDIGIQYHLDNEEFKKVGPTTLFYFCRKDKNCFLGFNFDPYDKTLDTKKIQKKQVINERVNKQLPIYHILRGSFYQLDILELARERQTNLDMKKYIPIAKTKKKKQVMKKNTRKNIKKSNKD